MDHTESEERDGPGKVRPLPLALFWRPTPMASPEQWVEDSGGGLAS